MQENDLCTEIREFLKQALMDFKLPAYDKTYNGSEDDWEKQKTGIPKIVDGFLPPKRSDSAEDFPCVVVRFQSSDTVREMTTAKVLIACCVYSKLPNGYVNAVNLASRIRNLLLNLPDSVLAQRYILEPPVAMKLFEDQGWPYWQVDLTTTWSFQAVPIRTPKLGEPYA